MLVRESRSTGASSFSTRREAASNAPYCFCLVTCSLSPLCYALTTLVRLPDFALSLFSLSLSHLPYLPASSRRFSRSSPSLQVSNFFPFLVIPSVSLVIRHAARLTSRSVVIVRLLAPRSLSSVLSFSSLPRIRSAVAKTRDFGKTKVLLKQEDEEKGEKKEEKERKEKAAERGAEARK